MANRLAAEASPYLLQHAENPVDWYPWGPEAFEKARREDRPIFLSIGYSTCHWCHVMEHESFENDEVAAVLNRDFVSIKVDREERPDVDRVYMTFVQATTGSGGWPMSVWLTPDLKPFFGGTYFPPSARWGRPGFIEVLTEIARLWRSERHRVTSSADDLLARLRHASESRGIGTSPPQMASPSAVAEGASEFERAYDFRYGGFGDAPKFPRPTELLFLLRAHALTGEAAARQVAVGTLRGMALGGMRDQIGGGFHRYSVDGQWRVPHFEKMLYDQAQLVLAYLEAGQAMGDGFYTSVAQDTLDYVLRDLTDADGGFYSAEDADSLPPEHAGSPNAHKTEGAFYLWTMEELRRLLPTDANIVASRFGFAENGNALADPQGEFTGKNIPYVALSIEEVAAEKGRPADEVMAALARARHVMFEARGRRPRPHLDDKILTAWNGLTMAALARAGRTVPDAPAAARYLEAAQRAARFIRTALWRENDSVLLRRFRAGQSAIEGYCEDYANLIWGLIELVQTDGDPDWIRWAVALQRRQNELFWDDHEGGWFNTTGRDASVLLRMKEDYDGAEPSASSVSCHNLLTLAHLTGEDSFRALVERALGRFGPRMGGLARVVPHALSALAVYHAGMQQIVVVGPARGDRSPMQAAIAAAYLPFAIHVPVTSGEPQERLAEVLPFIGGMTARGGLDTAYVCREFTCLEPVTDVDALRRQLVPGTRA